MFITMDMGSSNTRVILCDDEGKIKERASASFGARLSVFEGRDALLDKTKKLIDSLPNEDVRFIVASGMATSELGLCEVSHICLPTGVKELSDNIVKEHIPQIAKIPFYFIPGIKKLENGLISDMMRGEETELFGCLDGDGCYLLPGTHNKAILVENGNITDFATSMSGEILRAVMENTMIKDSVSFQTELIRDYLIHGASYAKENGFNSAVFRVRTLSKQSGMTKDKLTSFLTGAVIGQDIPSIQRMAKGKRISITGNERLKQAYGALLEDFEVVLVKESESNHASHNGAVRIIKEYMK